MRLWVPFRKSSSSVVFPQSLNRFTVAVFIAEVCDVYGSSAVDWFFKP